MPDHQAQYANGTTVGDLMAAGGASDPPRVWRTCRGSSSRCSRVETPIDDSTSVIVDVVSIRDVLPLVDALTAELAGGGYDESEMFGYSAEKLEKNGVHLVGAATPVPRCSGTT